MKGFIVYPTYKAAGDNAFVHLFGRLENGESFEVVKKTRPYFFIKKEDLEKAKEIGSFDFEEVELKNFDREDVVKIILNIPAQVPKLRDLFHDNNIRTYEADVRFEYRFMIDNSLQGAIDIEGDFEKGEKVDRVYVEPKIKSTDYSPENLKILSFDIETDSKANKLYSISLVSEDYEKVLIVSEKKLKNAIGFKTEKSLLKKFSDLVKKLDPDVIVGWNVIDFDLKYLQKKFSKYDIPFVLGRTNDACRLTIYNSFFQDSRANFNGRIVLDGIQALKNNFISLPDYKLETAAKEFTDKKKIFEGEQRFEEIEKSYYEDQQKLVDYNLLDSKLVIEILDKSTAFNLTIKRSLLTGMPLDRVRASIASLDSLYLNHLRKKGFVASTSVYSERDPAKGGFVMDSKPGIYDYVIVCDFKSLYPSIMRTFNIDPLNFVPDCKGENLVKVPSGACFRNNEGVLPSLLESLWEQRDKAKKENNKPASFAIKILMNSFYGVLSNPNCRFYSKTLANSITLTGQHLIKKTAKMVEEKGYEVIYGDTDSIFVNLGVDNYKEAEKIGNQISKEINEFFKKHLTEEYNRPNYLELEFEKTYKRFLMPRSRGSEKGTKKRYVGLLENKDGEGELDFVGVEFVRSDWTQLAKDFQKELLDRVFHKKEVTSFVKKTVDDVKAGKVDEKLVYRKQLRKDLDEYTKTTPPHVKAARLLDKLDTYVIDYLITLDGPQPLEKVTSSIDYDHYIDKQLRPIADSILVFYDKSFDDILEGNSQTTLFGF
jgi:DNA polymerase-2